jgi:acyl-CoA synthetase (AMP-forming)/AMP-acid ligase II
VRPTPDGNFAGRLVRRIKPNSCLIDAATSRVMDAKDLPRMIAGHGRALLSAGLVKGDRVLIGCTLSPAAALVYLGAIYAGLVAVPVEERTLTAAPAMLLGVTGAKAVWIETGLRDEGIEHLTVLRLQGDLDGGGEAMMPAAAVAESELAALMSTSGSTGVPRFVMVTHGNLIANTEAIIRSQKLSREDRGMLILPLSYCFGTSLMQSHLYAGGSVVFDRRFMFPDKVLGAITEFGCTTFAGVPTVYNVLLRRSTVRKMSLPTLRRFLQAGGRLTPEKINEMRAAFPEIEFYVMYGQTEATARISCMEPERWEEKPGSVGRPLDNLTARIVEESGFEVPTGQIGHLWVKGPSISPGYWNNPVDTERVFQEGWLRTGDLARQDHEGYLWIEGRQSAFLKMRGMRVSFAEAETAVGAVPGVYECAARGVEHAEAGEALQLFIVADTGANLGLEEVRRRLPAHWAIDSIHLVSELPKTASGKIALSSLAVPAEGAHGVLG